MEGAKGVGLKRRTSEEGGPDGGTYRRFETASVSGLKRRTSGGRGAGAEAWPPVRVGIHPRFESADIREGEGLGWLARAVARARTDQSYL